MKIVASQFLLILLTTFSGVAQQSDSTLRYFNNFEDSSANMSWMNPHTIVEDNVLKGNHVSRTDATNPYSSGIEIYLPKHLRNRNFNIAINCSFRVFGQGNNIQLVVSLSNNDSAVFWKGINLKDSSDFGSWHKFHTSLLFPRNIPANSRLKIFLWNAGGTSVTEIDDFEVILKEENFPSFLPND